MRPRLHALCALALATLHAVPGRAQVHDEAAADSLFREAKAAEQRGDYATACPRFAESQRLDPAAGTLLNLADCEDHQGKTATAWEHFVEARDQLKPGDDRLPYAQQRVAALEPRVPHLVLRLRPDAPAGARVLRGQEVVGAAALGVPLAVDPGTVTLTVVAPGRVKHVETVTLQEGASKEVLLAAGEDERAPWPTVVVSPVPQAPTTPVPAAIVASGASSRRTLGWVVGGVGAAGLAFGAVTGVMAFGAAGTFKTHCDASGACRDSQGLDAAASGKTDAALSTVGFLVGAAGLGAGAYLLLGGSSTSPATTVGATPLPGGAGLAFTRGF